MSENDIRLRSFLSLEVNDVEEDDDGPDLLADKERVAKMVEGFLSAPALAAIAMVKVDDRKPKKITPKTRAGFAANGKEILVEYFDRETPERQAWASFTLYPGMLNLRSVVERDELAKHRATALDDLVAALLRAAEVWRGLAFVSQAQIKLEYCGNERPYARLRKPRTSMRYPQRSLVTLLDPRCTARAAEVAALTEPKPAHARVTKHGELVEVRWAKTLEDDDVAQASTRHECWIRRVETERDHMFNELGDEKVLAGNGKPRAPLDFYNPWWKRGFKAVAVGADGELERSAWDEACQVLKARTIAGDQGEPDAVEKIWIVVPTREQAIAVHARVVAAGFEAAVYPAERRRDEYWDPLPKGPWLSGSTDNGKPRT